MVRKGVLEKIGTTGKGTYNMLDRKGLTKDSYGSFRPRKAAGVTMAKKTTAKIVTAHKYEEATRKNISTTEYQSVLQNEEQNPVPVAYERRNRDLEPQLAWRGPRVEVPWLQLPCARENCDEVLAGRHGQQMV